jgi:hypothetical protein
MKYCKTAPSNQAIVDIFQGSWVSAFPDEYHITAGNIRHFDFQVEPRVMWGANTLQNGIKGLSVLELGPFEAYNTWQIEQLGAAPIAIESNNINYLKCLIVKEITGMKARFLYGDFIPYLEQCLTRFDIVWASGVLYHQVEPLKLLELISKVTDKVFIHTHYYEENVIKKNPGLSSVFFPKQDIVMKYKGYQVKLHYRSYGMDKSAPAFSGGAEEYSYWMEKMDIFEYLRNLGFDKVTMGVDDPGNPNGPAMFFMAVKSAG